MKTAAKHLISSLALLIVTSLALTAVSSCTSAGTAASSNEIQDTEIRMFNTEPFRPLVPGDTSEWGGGRLISMLFTGLVAYDLDTAAPHNAMAESIETSDSKVFTIKIKKGWKFHDGTEVKAQNYVNSWNYTAYGPHQQRNKTFLEKIKGYADLNPAARPGEPAPSPTTDKLSGLRIINDYEFEVTLSEPFSVFPTMVGYWAFYPLPDSFFSDHAGYLRHPIGNGPYKFVEMKPGSHQRLTAFTDYRGAEKPRIKDLRYNEYPDTKAAYRALVKGELDFMEAMPYEVITSGQYKTDLDGRYTDRNFLLMQTLAFPSYRPAYNDPNLRKAVSMAINREDLIKSKIGGGQRASDGFAIPGVEGFIRGQCGELCTYNPEKAREYLAKSGFKGTLELYTNVESGARTWMGPVCQSITATLGIGCQTKHSTSFKDFRKAIVERNVNGIYRSDWRADYPSIQNFLAPLYRTGASSNDFGFSDPRFDAALAAADRAPNKQEGIARYQHAERILVESMPVVPLWQEWSAVGWSPRLTNVKVSILTDIDIFKVRVVEPVK